MIENNPNFDKKVKEKKGKKIRNKKKNDQIEKHYI